VPVFPDGRELSPWEATGVVIESGAGAELYVDWHKQRVLLWEADGVAGRSRLYHSCRGGLR